MREVVIQTEEPASTREATEILVKIINSNYVKADLENISKSTIHLNAEEITQLLRIIEKFEVLFDGDLGDWSTGTVDLGLNPGSKPFNSKYYPVPIVN